ncbi:UDP-N-acetylglucosamine diphosphorylase/glucosamine-1-phosphate N-acetyltransferase [SAR202 cluster bacterium AD-802-E10_MRT_200m]|nr:UDP-N-acetylglucosamine diphosphorylase/glucosamine-1-phosphate N-acetyltransferase [SAR202 cluster bacterium AD-802-E10_MRT_200m]MQF82774.1 UDP-N-acetylglucosamine diphosphorylase/glucosamine-1-phosphate N-acetyltransferase [SAR202 cluster bacterium AD-802-E10_MRT_200m]
MRLWSAVVLAAGTGSRMNSETPKVLHPACGLPLIDYVINSVLDSGIASLVLVVPAKDRMISARVNSSISYARQITPLGTGNAFLTAKSLLEDKTKNILCINGDTPLIETKTINELMEHHLVSGADVTILTANQVPQEGLGRIHRNQYGQVKKIIEAEELPVQQGEIQEFNGGVYCFRSELLWSRLENLTPSQRGEIRLTDLIVEVDQSGGQIETVQPTSNLELLGVNTRLQLAQVEGVIREKIRNACMMDGVTLIDPSATYIDSTVEIASDSVIFPNTYLYGQTRIGSGSAVGPNTIIIDSSVGEDCKILGSVVQGSVLENNATVGPFSHLRPGSTVETGVHIGNFVEIKESHVGQDSRIGHFSYIGDATLGSEVNIGAGTVTCNFDGMEKNLTVIGSNAFIGSSSMLVAPVQIGPRAITGAGSVVTEDVASDSLVVGVPARPRRQKRSMKNMDDC